jgi:RNA polymerase sigma factor (sigma-70 family)
MTAHETFPTIAKLIAYYARRLARHPQDRDDVVQEAVLDFFARFDPSHDQPGEIRVWIRWTVLGAAQRVRSRYKSHDPLIPTIPAPEQPEAIGTDERAIVLEAIGRLPQLQREVVTRLFGLDGREPQTATEIGRDMGNPYSVARARRKALERLREVLAPVAAG